MVAEVEVVAAVAVGPWAAEVVAAVAVGPWAAEVVVVGLWAVVVAVAPWAVVVADDRRRRQNLQGMAVSGDRVMVLAAVRGLTRGTTIATPFTGGAT